MDTKKIYTKEDVDEVYKEYAKEHKVRHRKDYVHTTIYSVMNSFCLDYVQEGENLIMPENTFNKVCDIILNSIKYSIGEIEGITATELRDLSSNYLDTKFICKNIFYIISQPFDILDERLFKKRQNWIKFMETCLCPITYHGGIIFDKNEAIEFFSNISSISKLHQIMKSRLSDLTGIEMTLNTVYKTLIKDFSDSSVNFNEFKIDCMGVTYYRNDILPKLEEALRVKMIKHSNERDYYSALEFTKKFKCGFVPLQKHIDNSIVFAEKIVCGTKTEYRIPLSEVERIQEFKDTHISLSQICKMYKEDIDNKVIERRHIKKLFEDNNFFNCNVVEANDTCFSTKNAFFIERNDLEVFTDAINTMKDEMQYNSQDYETKLTNSLDILKEVAPITRDYLNDFIFIRRAGWKNPPVKSYNDVASFLYSNLTKEIFEYDDLEIREFLIEGNAIFTNLNAKAFLCLFINFVQSKTSCNYKNEYIFDYKSKREVDVSPYTMEQMFKFAVLVFNETHPLYQQRINDCIEKRNIASTWLYVALHFVSAWRTSDYINTLPRITIPTNTYQEFFDIVKRGEFTDSMAEDIVTEVVDKVKFLELNPKKTENRNHHSLLLDIPVSARKTIGLLLGLCEAHLQKEEDVESTYITTYVKNDWIYKKIFGEEFINIFGDKYFSNIKANKFYLNSIAKKADDEDIGSGYIIASLARAHNFTLDKLSNTTAVYLKYFKDLTNSEILTKTLFERGVCSFIPYMALKIIDGDVDIKNLSMDKKTELISQMPSPLDTEIFIKEQSIVLSKCKEDINDLISFFNHSDPKKIKEDVYRFVSKIAKGTAVSKNDNIDCIAVAKGLGCLYPKKQDCIGCGQEMYLKSAFYSLGEISYKLTNNYKNAKTKESAMKYACIIKQVIEPILKNFIVCLKTIYKIEDISEYKKIYACLEN
ncbi:MAG: hypothetical protein IJ086_05545 [Clostridium sp.]|nr:hypothetical protein [Clostridium sp.]